MKKIYWGSLFPTKLSFIVFVLYILLFVNQGKFMKNYTTTFN